MWSRRRASEAVDDLWVRRGADALLSVNRSTWDMVVPELRAVMVRLRPDLLEAQWCFDRPVDDDIRELVSEAETTCIADFLPPPRDWAVTYTAVHLPTSVRVNDALVDGWRLLFLRREMSWGNPGSRY